VTHISANELKTRGVAAIEAALLDHTEAIVCVRGKERFAVMDISQYNYLANASSTPPWLRRVPIWRLGDR